MIIHPKDLKKTKNIEIKQAINRGKRNAHKLSPNAKAANLTKTIFVAFALIAIVFSLIIMSYNLISPQVKKLEKAEKPSTNAELNTESKPELKEGEVLMIYNPETKSFEASLD